jgi:hypothetical protein
MRRTELGWLIRCLLQLEGDLLALKLKGAAIDPALPELPRDREEISKFLQKLGPIRKWRPATHSTLATIQDILCLLVA